MAKNKAKFKKRTIVEDFGDSGGFGEYYESTGGGRPFARGNSNTRTTKENGNLRKKENDTMQPRTDDGKFTYKSVNGQSINPKYGPSRGKTVNPLLTEGTNGVYIDDVKDQFEAKEGGYWEKYKDSWYQEASETVLRERENGKYSFKVHVSGEAIWDVGKKIFNEVTGDFGGDIVADHVNPAGKKFHLEGYGGKEESKNFDERKKGRTSGDAKTAIKSAKKDGNTENWVIDSKEEGIKSRGEKGEEQQPKTPEQGNKQPIVPNVPKEKQPEKQPRSDISNEPEEPVSGRSTKKNDASKVAKYVSWIKQLPNLGDKQKKEYIDDILSGRISDKDLDDDMTDDDFVKWLRKK